jgi:hypothetical protein
MTTYVMRDGRLVNKAEYLNRGQVTVDFPTFPMPGVSRFEPMASPVTGGTISSWRERDRDMQAVNAFDGRDLPKDHVFSRGLDVQRKEQADAARREPDQPIWRD